MFRRIFLPLLVWANSAMAGDAPTVSLAAHLFPPTTATSVMNGQLAVTDDSGTIFWTQPGSKISQVSYLAEGTPTVCVSLMVRHAATVQENNFVYGKAKAARQAVTVPGLGDDAFLTMDHVLHIRSGQDWLAITASNLGVPDLSMQEEAGRDALAVLQP